MKSCFLKLCFITLIYPTSILAQNNDLDSLDWKVFRQSLLIQDNEAKALRQHFDSLFLEKEYKRIIEECKKIPREQHLNKIINYNLIAANYFNGNEIESMKLIHEELKKFTTSGIGASTLLSESFTSYLYFLNVEENWRYVENEVRKIALQAFINEKVTELEHAIILFDFFIADQKNRLFYNYTIDTIDNLFNFQHYKGKTEFEMTEEKVCKEIFEFYQKVGRLFSKAEIGELHYLQLVFLLHDIDLKRREYYLELLSKAVDEGVFIIDKKLDFLIVNELNKVKWENMNEVINKYEKLLKKEYNLPNYKFSLVM